MDSSVFLRPQNDGVAEFFSVAGDIICDDESKLSVRVKYKVNKKTSFEVFLSNGREETPLNRRRTNESRTSQDTRRAELRNLRQREQITSSMSQNKKTSRRKFKNGREETRTLTPKAPVPKTGASTIPPLVHKKEKLVTGFEPATY